LSNLSNLEIARNSLLEKTQKIWVHLSFLLENFADKYESRHSKYEINFKNTEKTHTGVIYYYFNDGKNYFEIYVYDIFFHDFYKKIGAFSVIFGARPKQYNVLRERIRYGESLEGGSDLVVIGNGWEEKHINENLISVSFPASEEEDAVKIFLHISTVMQAVERKYKIS